MPNVTLYLTDKDFSDFRALTNVKANGKDLSFHPDDRIPKKIITIARAVLSTATTQGPESS